MTSTFFIQWNVQGMGTSKEDLMKLVEEYKPIVIAGQETQYGANFISNINGYAGICKQGHFNRKNHGGVILYIHRSCPHTQIQVHSDYQIVAARVNIGSNKTVTVASIYLPGRVPIQEEKLRDSINELPKPILLMGDLNAHHVDWGNKNTDSRGTIIKNLSNIMNLNIINDGQPTHISGTVIDLTIASADINPDLKCITMQSPCSSDHYPILIAVTTERYQETETLNYKTVQWEDFKKDEEWKRLEEISKKTPKEAVDELYEMLNNLIERYIPKYQRRRYYPKTWWTEECGEAWKAREKSYRRYKESGRVEDKILWKKNRAKATRAFRQAKKESWRAYVSSLNSGAKTRELWRTVNKLRGKGTREITILSSGGEIYAECGQIAQKLADTFADIASAENYSQKFKRIKEAAEQHLLNFKPTKDEPYNSIFTLKELNDAIDSNKKTSPGPDRIHNLMIKNIPETSLPYFLKIFNTMWISSYIPEGWKKATIVPIPKLEKDSRDPTNYRPISLTSCVGKTFEKIVNRRLVEVLENNKILASIQCGFRKYHSTVDHLVRFDTYIRKAFAEGKHVTAVYFDLEKAYDLTWRYGIMKDLHDAGIRGRMAHYVSNFLRDRKYRVRVGNVYSSWKDQEIGVPQGSTLSVTLFALKINSLAKVVPNEIFASMFVDDILIAYAHHSPREVESRLQNSVNTITDWADKNGFKFSEKKTKAMQFFKKSQPAYKTNLTLKGKTIPLVDHAKFLGLIFDEKLNWGPHISNLKARCNKDLNLMKSLTATQWGANQETLMKLYRVVMRPKIDYGSIVYGAASGEKLQLVETIQNEALRVSSAAFKSTPVANLQILLNEPSLELRRQEMLLRYFFKLKSHLQNPAYPCIINSQLELFFRSRNYDTSPVVMRVQRAISAHSIPIQPVLPYITPKTYSWQIGRPEIECSLSVFKKNNTPTSILKAMAKDQIAKFEDFKHIFTDGSRSENGVGAAAVMNDIVKRSSLPHIASIFTAELHAISLALKIIQENAHMKYAIFIDSLSAIDALVRGDYDNHQVWRIMVRMSEMQERGITIALCWIPSHVGIDGNERADEAAKSAARQVPEFICVPYQDWHTMIRRKKNQIWEDKWKGERRSMIAIKNKPGKWKENRKLKRRDEVVINRVRLEHTNITHSYRFDVEAEGQPPICNHCSDSILTVKHILVDCQRLRRHRDYFFGAESEWSIKSLIGEGCNTEKVVAYLRATGYYDKI